MGYFSGITALILTKVFLTDVELLEGLAEGNRSAVAAIYRSYHSILIKWIVGRGGSEADAQDVFQEALIVLYEKSKSAEFCLTCKLGTYLFAICKRLWYKKVERSTLFSAFDADNDEDTDHYDEDIGHHIEKETQYEKLENALTELGEPCSSLLKAFYVDKLSMQEIAAVFNYTNAENAKTQKYKCLTRLKKIFFLAEVKTKS